MNDPITVHNRGYSTAILWLSTGEPTDHLSRLRSLRQLHPDQPYKIFKIRPFFLRKRFNCASHKTDARWNSYKMSNDNSLLLLFSTWLNNPKRRHIIQHQIVSGQLYFKANLKWYTSDDTDTILTVSPTVTLNTFQCTLFISSS